MALYLSSKGAENVKAKSLMPHEDAPKQLSLEEYMAQKFGE